MSEHPAQHNDYQDRDIRIRPLAIFLFATLVVTGLTIMGVKVLFNSYARSAGEETIQVAERAMLLSRPTNAVVEVMGEAAEAMRQMRLEVDAVLNHYRVVDPEAGVVQIPVARAMELVVEKGMLPVRSE